MKGKFRILGNVGLALFVACALMLAVMPMQQVEASSSVSSVWMEFETAGHNDIDTAAQYTIHFTTGSALSRGVDTITVIFPDGIDSDMGPVTTQDDYDFELGSAVTTASNYSVDPTGDPLGTGTTYVTCTSAATIAGYRVQVTTPVDIPASTAATLKIATGATITTPHVAASTYKIKVATSQDTTFVLSDAFSVDDTAVTVVNSVTNFPSSLVAGSAAAYKFSFRCATTVPIGGTVTVQFPVGFTVPSPISTSQVKIGDNSIDPACSAVSVNTAARTVTATTAEELDAYVDDPDTETSYIYFLVDSGIKNKTTATDDVHIYLWTSTDGQKVEQADDDDDIAAGTATKLAFCSDSDNGYSDDATILYAFTDALIIRSVDQYGNLKHITGTEPTVKLSVEGGTGTFSYTSQTTANPYTDHEMADGKLYADKIYYRPTSVGTHTLKAETVGSPSLTSATWTVYVAPAVVLKDANNQTIGTYGPTSTSTDDATYGGAWIQSAIDAAFPGDTVELGGSSGAPAIYELSTVITLSKKITLTSANGASYTTLRPTTDAIDAVKVTTDGTPTNPIIIDGLTFTRLRKDYEFDQGVYNNGYDYLTVRNCVFDYILPANASDHEYGAVVGIILHPQENAEANTITSATISNNTFTNCCPFAAPSASEAAVINIMTKASAASGESITGVTISGNTLTNCNGINININGYAGVGGIGADESYVTANVTDNTITNPVIGIDVQRQTHSVKILRNTVAGAYCAALYVESCASGDHDSLVIKNNTFTGAAGASKKWFSTSGAVVLEADGGTATTDVNTVQFNDIYNNDATYSIYVTSGIGAQDCQYNYYGDATGPYYSALAGATITTSNTSGTGKKVTDLVTYYPWLYKSRADVVTDNANYCAQRISLAVGIHTLSTPALLIPTADTIAELMPDYATNMEYCYKYDDGIWSNIGTDTLTPCHAYYIKMSVADSVLLQYDADEYYTPSWLLDEGWNLIGLASLSDMDVDDSVASVLLDSAGLPGYSQVISPSMNASSWSFSAGGTVGEKDLVVGEGYWIYMQNDATLAGFTIFPLVPDLD